MKTVKVRDFTVYLFGRTFPIQTREKFFVCFNLNTSARLTGVNNNERFPVALLSALTTFAGPEEPLVAATFNAHLRS